MTTAGDPVTIRLAAGADGDALKRLAHLDSSPPLRGRCLVAEVDGEPCAAVAIDGGRTVADPFVRCAEVLDLLALRAAQLRDAPFPERPSLGAIAPLAGRSPLPS